MPLGKIKKSLVFVLCMSFPEFLSTLPKQQLQHESLTINVEVPVRVFSGDAFVDNLTIDDFEIFEDGILQRIESVYLVKETRIAREESGLPRVEGGKPFSPELTRHFVLVFEVIDYLPKLRTVIDYFFQRVYQGGDTLTVITPKRTYTFKEAALGRLPREEIVRQLADKLRADIVTANSEYKTLIKDIEELYTQSGIFYWETGDWKAVTRELLDQLDVLRAVSEERLLKFSDFLRSKSGQKNVFMFFQAELVPKYDAHIENLLTSGNPEENPAIVFEFMDLGSHYRRETTFDVDKIKKIFSDASIQIHFLFMTKDPIHELSVERMESLNSDHIRYVEQSEDIFKAFSQVADATGGYTASSQDAASIFKKAVDAAKNYYVLYYSPQNYREDGKFHSIKVKVKGGDYRITHRAGYLAD